MNPIEIPAKPSAGALCRQSAKGLGARGRRLRWAPVYKYKYKYKYKCKHKHKYKRIGGKRGELA